MLTKKEAKKKGHELLAKMKTQGWELDVWQNLGWHYCLRKKYITLYPTTSGRYFTLMGENGAGEIYFSTKGSYFKDPNKAVEHQLVVAILHVSKCNRKIFDTIYL
jgi:hypothetical protein